MRYHDLLFDLDDTLLDFNQAETQALHNLFTSYQLPSYDAKFITSL